MRTFELAEQDIDSTQIQGIRCHILNDDEIENVIIRSVLFQELEDLETLIRSILEKRNIRSLTLAIVTLPGNILDLVCSSTTLQRLNIGFCAVDASTPIALPQIQNTTLKQLSISNLTATPPQLDQLLTSISSFTALNLLDLSTHLGILGPQIPEILTNCPQLDSLDLTSAVIDEHCLSAILATIEQHNMLTELNFDAAVISNYTNLPNEFLDSTRAVLLRNTLTRDQQPQLAPRLYSHFYPPGSPAPQSSLPYDDQDQFVAR